MLPWIAQRREVVEEGNADRGFHDRLRTDEGTDESQRPVTGKPGKSVNTRFQVIAVGLPPGPLVERMVSLQSGAR